jgi:hypothetical protein
MGAFDLSNADSIRPEYRAKALTADWETGVAPGPGWGVAAAERMRISLRGGVADVPKSRPTMFERYRAECNREESFGAFVRRMRGR